MFVVVSLQKCFMHVYGYIVNYLWTKFNVLCSYGVLSTKPKIKEIISGCYSTKQYMKKAGYFSKI